MNNKRFPNKGDYSPILLILSFILLSGAIFSFFLARKKKDVLEEDGEEKQNPKDFI